MSISITCDDLAHRFLKNGSYIDIQEATLVVMKEAMFALHRPSDSTPTSHHVIRPKASKKLSCAPRILLRQTEELKVHTIRLSPVQTERVPAWQLRDKFLGVCMMVSMPPRSTCIPDVFFGPAWLDDYRAQPVGARTWHTAERPSLAQSHSHSSVVDEALESHRNYGLVSMAQDVWLPRIAAPSLGDLQLAGCGVKPTFPAPQALLAFVSIRLLCFITHVTVVHVEKYNRKWRYMV